jgi:hypothetical protein
VLPDVLKEDLEDVRAQQILLLSEIMNAFTRRIRLAREDGIKTIELHALALLIVHEGINCTLQELLGTEEHVRAVLDSSAVTDRNR